MAIHIDHEHSCGIGKTTKELEINWYSEGYEFRGRIPEMVTDGQI